MATVPVSSEELSPGALPVVDFSKHSYPVFWLDEDGRTVGCSYSREGHMMLPLVELTARSRKDLTRKVFLSLSRLGAAAGFPGQAVVFVRHSWFFADGDRPGQFLFALMASFAYHVAPEKEHACSAAGRLMSCTIPFRIPSGHDAGALERLVVAMDVMTD